MLSHVAKTEEYHQDYEALTIVEREQQKYILTNGVVTFYPILPHSLKVIL